MRPRAFDQRGILPPSAPESMHDAADDGQSPEPPDEQPSGVAGDLAPPYLTVGRRTHPVRSFLTVPDALRGSATTPAATAVAGVALVAVLIAMVLLGRWWWQEAESTEERIPPPAEVLSTASLSAATGGSGGAPASRVGTAEAQAPEIAPASEAATAAVQVAESSTVVVHVAGKVRKPGVVTLPSEARVVDAVQAAGGMVAGADAQTVNLARPVLDGEQIVVLAKGQTAAGAGTAAPGARAAAAPGAVATPSAAGGKVDLNRADQAALETLPGVGPVLAGRIIEWRTRNGKFSSVEELGEVSGVGEKTFARLAPLVTV